MMMKNSSLPTITFVIHDIEGGVASMNYQIIENAGFRDHFHVHILLWRSEERTSRPFGGTFRNVDEVTRFTYSTFDNYYLTLKRFDAVLNKYSGLIVTNDGLELETIRRFGSSSVLVSIVHDYYNLKLAVENADIVDFFICHTDTFSRALSSNSALRQRVHFQLHGVKV